MGRGTFSVRGAYAPCLGEHNDYVLRGIADLTPKEIAELESEGIIGTVPVGAK